MCIPHKTHKYTINCRYYVGHSAEICAPLFTRLVEFSHADMTTMLCYQHSSKHIYVQHFIQHAVPPHKIKLIKFLRLQCTIWSLKRMAMKVSLDVSPPPYLYIKVFCLQARNFSQTKLKVIKELKPKKWLHLNKGSATNYEQCLEYASLSSSIQHGGTLYKASGICPWLHQRHLCKH